MDPKDLNYPCREFSNSGLGIVVAFLVCWQIDLFVCVLLIGKPAVKCGPKRTYDK